MRWPGGIPVQRDRSSGLVGSTAAALQSASVLLQRVVAPEGTRSRATQWKTGFHRTARGASLPIQLSYLDWRTRRCGRGPVLDASDDVDAGLARIKAFCAPFGGRHVEQFDRGWDGVGSRREAWIACAQLRPERRLRGCSLSSSANCCFSRSSNARA
jgi:hypothetical protein